MAAVLTVSGTLPSDDRDYAASVSREVIALRLGDRICAAHRNWMTFEQARALVDQIGWLLRELTDQEVVHACPPDGSDLMPCCGRTPFEVPRTDRMATDRRLVTCSQPTNPDGAS